MTTDTGKCTTIYIRLDWIKLILLLIILHLDRTQVVPTDKGPLYIVTYNYIFHAPESNIVGYNT